MGRVEDRAGRGAAGGAAIPPERSRRGGTHPDKDAKRCSSGIRYHRTAGTAVLAHGSGRRSMVLAGSAPPRGHTRSGVHNITSRPAWPPGQLVSRGDGHGPLRPRSAVARPAGGRRRDARTSGPWPHLRRHDRRGPLVCGDGGAHASWTRRWTARASRRPARPAAFRTVARASARPCGPAAARYRHAGSEVAWPGQSQPPRLDGRGAVEQVEVQRPHRGRVGRPAERGRAR